MVLPVAAAGAVAAGSGATGAGAASAGAAAAGGGTAGASAAGGGTAAGAAGTRAGTGARGAGVQGGASRQAMPEEESAARLRGAQSRQRRLQEQEEEDAGGAEPVQEPKISTVMAIFGCMFLGAIDITEIILILFAIDDFFLLDILASLLTVLYLWWKGARGTYNLVFQLIEWIPYIGWLPLRTVGWVMTIWIDRHPKSTIAQTAQVAQRATPQASKISPKTNVAA